MKGQKMRGGKTLRHGASGGVFKGERLATRLACGAEQGVCVCECKALCTHTCVLAGHGGESLVFRAEGPEAEKSSTDLKTHEGSSLPGVCWVGGQSMWDPRHSPRRTSQAEFGV